MSLPDVHAKPRRLPKDYRSEQTMPPDELRRVADLLLPRRWIFAKTMPQTPHWYTLRKEWPSDEDFVSVVQSIRDYGYHEWFRGRRYTMLNLNGMKYWTMGAPLDVTILINRKHLGAEDPPAAYDVIAPGYDDAFSDPDSLSENEIIMGLLGDVSRDRVLDIGCGTGLLLDYLSPVSYTGIDPSREMLDRLRQRHPKYADRVYQAKLEEFWDGGGYDTVVCLFGSANYIDPEALRSIPSFLKPGGRYFIMFLAPGYIPETYARTGHSTPFHPGVHADLPGSWRVLNNFIIVEGRV